MVALLKNASTLFTIFCKHITNDMNYFFLFLVSMTGFAPCMMFVEGVGSVSRFAAEDQGICGLSLGDF